MEEQLHSIGATIKEVQDIMIAEGCVNAANLDGGSSSVMYYEGKLLIDQAVNIRSLYQVLG